MTRYALVPVDLDTEMLKAALENSLRIMKRDGTRELMPDEPGPRPTEVITSAWSAKLAASPGQGAVTAAQLEAAAEAIDKKWGFDTIHGLSIEVVRQVIESIGLTVQP